MSVPVARRQLLQSGQMEAATLQEILSVDFAALLEAVLPELAQQQADAVREIASLGISARMTRMGKLLLANLSEEEIAGLQTQRSDTVRGWACFIIGARDMGLAARLAAIRPFADDPHFGVREWAWLAVRTTIVLELDDALTLLAGWSQDPSERVRRFASEATRPRGVWCSHIASLKLNPEPGRAILDPLRDDPSTYVQDSVGNWLNDAAKSQPGWVRALGAEWLASSPTPATQRIVRRGLRSIDTISKPKRKQ
ncbi:hypothetical protein NA8A_20527 [Nitratireductor indicus C115]|uniref:DNA alkylation repair protein n=1 Tax=Nitratireductor indicus C115 TaxID=1231190 RepID=K2MZ70_9HYPH|nr:DNA alkylation repair protein [Nitratireductor indicus]EKF40548.1 hypothetical protein NA8A_20527 [Nitratireductor indicus C115]SFQ49312.1 3-methyladenine DNA glycosylase AlkC [Nitratireductor indicus]